MDVTFVPHLVPLDRGILETIYVKTTADATAERISDAYQRAYATEPETRALTVQRQARRAKRTPSRT